MIKTLFNQIIIILFFVEVTSCQKDKEVIYPAEPYIEFKNVEISNEMDDDIGQYQILNLLLNYTDGDSNLFKNNSNDTSFNCITAIYKKQNGIFQLTTPPHNYVIKGIEKPNHTYQQGPVTIKTRSFYDGELQIQIFYFNMPFIVGDTIKSTVQIIDRDRNESNIAEIDNIFTK